MFLPLREADSTEGSNTGRAAIAALGLLITAVGEASDEQEEDEAMEAVIEEEDEQMAPNEDSDFTGYELELPPDELEAPSLAELSNPPFRQRSSCLF